MQLGLRLWCQPITLLPDEVVVAYAAPHDRTLKHQVRGGTKDGRKVWVGWPLCGSQPPVVAFDLTRFILFR